MKKIIPILFAIFVYGCSNVDQPLEAFTKDGRYTVETSRTQSGIIVLTVREGEKEINSIITGASIYQKYAIGFLKDEAVLILYSSDIGIKAWGEESGFKVELKSGKYTHYASELYKAKYGENT